MWTTFESLAVFGLIVVIAVLLIGIGIMARDRGNETEDSETAMWWRVGVQAAVILLIMLAIWLAV